MLEGVVAGLEEEKTEKELDSGGGGEECRWESWGREG